LLAEPPYPNWADASYLASYPFLYAGLVLLLLRARLRPVRTSLWLDGAVSGLTLAALATALLWRIMRQHTLVGERILAAAPALSAVARLVRLSHERWDGRGYPDGLEGEDIPIGARVIAVCDTYDAITSKRSYADARSHEEALAELQRCAGTQFDPVAVNAFCAANPAALSAAPVASA
jgi:hypothetical protein